MPASGAAAASLRADIGDLQPTTPSARPSAATHRVDARWRHARLRDESWCDGRLSMATASGGVETDEADVERLFVPVDSWNQKHDFFEWGLAVIAEGRDRGIGPAVFVEGRPGDGAAV